MAKITFMGIPVTDTIAVLDALKAFYASQEDRCEELLWDFDESEFFSPDVWEDVPFTQSVNWRHSVRWFDQSRKYWRVPNKDVWREYGNRPKFRPKRKAVK